MNPKSSATMMRKFGLDFVIGYDFGAICTYIDAATVWHLREIATCPKEEIRSIAKKGATLRKGRLNKVWNMN